MINQNWNPLTCDFNVTPTQLSIILTLGFNNTEGNTYTIKVFDPSASIILEESDNLTVGNYTVSLHGKPKGTYQAVLQIDNVTLTRKLTKYEE